MTVFVEIFSKISRSVQVDFTRALLPRPVTYNFQFDNCRSKILSTIQKFKVFYFENYHPENYKCYEWYLTSTIIYMHACTLSNPPQYKIWNL